MRDTAAVRLPAFGTVLVPEWQSEVVFSTLGREALALGLGQTVKAVFAYDTTLFIANHSSIVVLKPDGSYLRTAGRSGDGPGEFREILSFGINGDGGLFASELLTGRLTRLSMQGGLTQHIPRVPSFPLGRENELISAIDSGRALAVPWQGRPGVDVESGFIDGPFKRERVTVTLRDTVGAVVDSLGSWAGWQRVGSLPIRFARGVVFDGRENMSIIGVSDSVDLTFFEGARRVRRLVGPPTNRAITPADDAAWRVGIERERADVAGTLFKVNDETTLPATLPTVGGVVLSERGEIWIGEYVTPADSVRRWHIYSRLGVPLGAITLPALTAAFLPTGTELLDVARGRVALLRQMADGELVVEVRRLVKGTE